MAEGLKLWHQSTTTLHRMALHPDVVVETKTFAHRLRGDEGKRVYMQARRVL